MTSGLSGLLNASFELVHRLQRAGHEVSYASPAEVGDRVRAQGIDYTQMPAVNFDPAPQPRKPSGARPGLRSRLAEWRSAGRRRQAGIEALNLSQFTSYIKSRPPELLLIDAELYEHVFTAYSLGIRLALITPFYPTWKRSGLPPLQLDITPGVGWQGSRAGLELVWLKLRLQRWLTIKTISVRNAFTERRSVLRSYARRLGFPLSCLEQCGWVTLFNFHRLPVLSLTARELDFPHLPPSWLRYVGPMVSAERTESVVEPLTRAHLEAVYAESRTSCRPLLYCWLTTMEAADEGFLDTLLQAVARHPEWLVVIGFTGRKAADFRGLPAHVHAFDFVPQIEVLREADLCITHGGVNTINECIQIQVPMLVYSTGFADKHGCAARLAYHGLCHRGDIQRDGATEIEERIDAALADSGIHERLAAMRAKTERYRDEQVLEHAVASLLASGKTGPA